MKYIFILLLGLTNLANAQAPLVVQKVSDSVYALVGETKQRSADNLGNNSTHGVIITNDGVILIDSGASFLGAQQIHQAIKKSPTSQ